MIDGLFARLKRQWLRIVGVGGALGALAAVLASTGKARDQVVAGLGQFGLSQGFATPVIVVVTGFVGWFVVYLRQRMETQNLLAERPRRLRSTTATAMGVAVCSRAVPSARGDKGEPHYFERKDLDARLQSALEPSRGRFVLVVGDEVSGVTHTAYRNIRAYFRGGTRILVPAPAGAEPYERLGALLEATFPFRPGRSVVWIDRLDTRLVAGELTPGQIRGFQRRHSRTWLVATLRTETYQRIRDSTDPEQSPLRELLAHAQIITVPHEFAEVDLDPVRAAFADVPDDRLRRLPEFLVAYDEHIARFERHDEQRLGHAIVQAAIDWQRCGARRGAPTEYLKAAARGYLPRARRASVTEETFAEALEWASAPFVASSALIERDEDGDWTVPSILVDYVRRTHAFVPPFAWSAVIEAVRRDGTSLLAVAANAESLGVDSAASGAWSALLKLQEPASVIASNALAGRADAEAVLRGERIPQLLRQRREHSALDALTARSPRAMRAGPQSGSGFDHYVPQPTDGFSVGLYRLKTLRSVLRVAVLALLDVIAVLAGLLIGHLLRGWVHRDLVPPDVFDGIEALAPYSVAFALVTFAAAGAYRADARRARLDQIVLALAAASAAAGIVGAAHGEGVLYSTVAWASFSLALPVCFGLRAGYDAVSQWWVRRNHLETRTLLIGERAAALEARNRLLTSVRRPMRFVGYLSEDAEDTSPDRLGTIDQLERVLPAHAVHQVIVVSDLPPEETVHILDLCVIAGADASLALSLAEMEVFNRRVPIGETLPLQRLLPVSLSPSAAATKRAFDLVVAGTATLLLSPLLALTAIAVRLDGPGPVLYRTPRPGYGRDAFGMWKFRTIRYEFVNGYVPVGVGEVTRTGRVLRRFALDELPQLFNVLAGTMSLVGPRPLPLADYRQMKPWHRRRYLVKPGITGLWQIGDRPLAIDYDETVRSDFLYMRGWSLWRDIEILLRTPITVVMTETNRPTPHP